MLFSTKASPGSPDDRAGSPARIAPIWLNSVSEAERLPLSYLERLVAKLRKADLVASTRGAHGGYGLAKPAEEIAMDAVVEALEGRIAPMKCFHEYPGGQSRLLARVRRRPGCSAQLLWTRVQNSVTKALTSTTLAELVEPRPQAGAPRQRSLAPPRGTSPNHHETRANG